MNLPDAALILLNYNGKSLLEKYLASFVEASKLSRANCRVIVLDNQSRDDSIAYVRTHFPNVVIFQASQNKVLCSFNEIMSHLTEEVVVLLNNDMKAEPHFVDPLLRPFREKKDIFFTATHGDKSSPRIRWGTLSADTSSLQNNPQQLETPGFVFSAGVAAFDRKKFQALGGYDEMYLPGYYEDVDLCYRAWKHGWKGYYAPESRKTHEGSASFKATYGSFFIQKLAYRNSILFMIKNIRDKTLLIQWVLMLFLRLLTAWLTGHFFVYAGFWEALPKIKQALQARIKVKSLFHLSDQQVLQTFGAAV